MTELDRVLAFIDEADDLIADRIEPSAYGTAVVNERLNLVHDLNFLRLRLGSPDAAALAAECERIQGAAGLRHRSVFVREPDERRLGPGFEELGWALDPFEAMVARRAPDRSHDLDLAEEVDHEELRHVWAEGIRSEEFARGREDLVEQLVEHKRVIADAVPTRYFAARVDGAIGSYCELYSLDGTAQIESLMTLERYRGHGLASAVVLRALAEARARGSELVFLVADRNDWPKELYRRLGFDTVGGYARFIHRGAES